MGIVSVFFTSFSRYPVVRLLLFFGLFGVFPFSVFAEMRPLSQGELRDAVRQERVLSSEDVISGMPGVEATDILEFRAFEIGETLIYRIVFRDADGAVTSVMIDAATGKEVTALSSPGPSIWRCEDTRLPVFGHDEALTRE